MKEQKLIPPTSYQGGKQRIANEIVNIIGKPNKFVELCCGSGAISLEMVNQGYDPCNITMVDQGLYGLFYETVANNTYDITLLQNEIDKLPDKPLIQQYFQTLTKQPVNIAKLPYQYLLIQSGAFGSKQIWVKDGKWYNATFRNYWLPTPTSNRKSPVNPTMPEPNTLLERTSNIVVNLAGKIKAYNSDIFEYLDKNLDSSVTYYIDPPYADTCKYGFDFDIDKLIAIIKDNNLQAYISYNSPIATADKTIKINTVRNKGGISGNRKRTPNEEWLNIFERKELCN